MRAEFEQILEQAKPRVAELCRDLAVDELRLFGSAASDAFDPAASDVDLVVEFRDHDAPGISDRYFSLAEGLERIFQRPVDLVTTRAIKNPYFRRIVDETSRLIYAA
ncbi:MAG: nucleotidyltransferase family protein [Chthoniobacterales bacterium]